MDEVSVAEMTKSIEMALEDDKPCLRNAPFDEFPDIEFRWFLTRDLNKDEPENVKASSEQISSSGTHLIFIGMNPAEATYFGPTSEGGDSTCARIVNAFAGRYLPENFYPVSRLSFFNLIPIVHQRPSEAQQKWNKVSSYHTGILATNLEVLSRLLTIKDNFILIPAFGVKMKPSDWRWKGFEKIFPLLKGTFDDMDISDRNDRLLSVRNNYHPRGWPSNETLGTAFSPAWEKLECLARKSQRSRSPRSS